MDQLHNIIFNLFNDQANKTFLNNYYSFLSDQPSSITILLEYLQALIRKEVILPSTENQNDLYITLILFVLVLLKRMIESNPEIYYTKDKVERMKIREFCIHFAISKDNPWIKVQRIMKSAVNLLVTFIKYFYDIDIDENLKGDVESSLRLLENSQLQYQLKEKKKTNIHLIPLNFKQEHILESTLNYLVANDCPHSTLLHLLENIVESVVLSRYDFILIMVLSVIHNHQSKLNNDESRFIISSSLRVLRNISIHSGSSAEVIQLLEVLLKSSLTNEIQIEGYKLFDEIIKNNNSVISSNPEYVFELAYISVMRESKRFEDNLVINSLNTHVYNHNGESIDTETMCLDLVQLLTSMISKNYFESLITENSTKMESFFYHILKLTQVTKSNLIDFFESPDIYLTDQIKEFTLRKACIEFFQELFDYHGVDEYTIAILFLKSIKHHLSETNSLETTFQSQRIEGVIFSLGSILPLIASQLLEDNSILTFLNSILQFSITKIDEYSISVQKGDVDNQNGFLSSRLIWFVSICLLNFPKEVFPNDFIQRFWSNILLIILKSKNSSISFLCVDAIASMVNQQGVESGENFINDILNLAPLNALNNVITCAWNLMYEDGTVDGEVPKLILEPLAHLLKYYPSMEPPTIFSLKNNEKICSNLFIYFTNNGNDSEVTEPMFQIAEQLMLRNSGGNLLLYSLQYITKFIESQKDNEEELYTLASVIEILSVLLFQTNSSNDSVIVNSIDGICSLLLNVSLNYKNNGRILESVQESLRILIRKYKSSISQNSIQKMINLIEIQLKDDSKENNAYSIGLLAIEIVNTYLLNHMEALDNFMKVLQKRESLNFNKNQRLLSQSIIILISRLYIQNLNPFNYINLNDFCPYFIQIGFDLDLCCESDKQYYVNALLKLIQEMGSKAHEKKIHIYKKKKDYTLFEAARLLFSRISASYEDKEVQRAVEKKYFSDWIYRKYCIDEEDPILFDDPLSVVNTSVESFLQLLGTINQSWIN